MGTQASLVQLLVLQDSVAVATTTMLVVAATVAVATRMTVSAVVATVRRRPHESGSIWLDWDHCGSVWCCMLIWSDTVTV